jgi:hypothetical protein
VHFNKYVWSRLKIKENSKLVEFNFINDNVPSNAVIVI